MRLEIAGTGGRTGLNFLIDFIISVVNCTLLIWLYASLRPMYGVGTRNALITSAFGVILGLALFISLINSGLLPLRVGLIGAVSNAIELPVVDYRGPRQALQDLQGVLMLTSAVELAGARGGSPDGNREDSSRGRLATVLRSSHNYGVFGETPAADQGAGPARGRARR